MPAPTESPEPGSMALKYEAQARVGAEAGVQRLRQFPFNWMDFCGATVRV